jgi:lipoyl(octanoyl) transferase
MIRTCADLGIEAGRHPEHRGVWVRSRKIGAVGVHLSRWVTSHGLAFNVRPDLSHFQVIVPCGIADPGLGVTSLEAELSGRAAPPTAEVEDRLATHLAGALGRT